jgi:2-polyprenyl-3-methyl-5-hydroxy-6-metoxy-1,4-benzoquinol methylase
MLKRRLGTVSLVLVTALGLAVTAFWLTGSPQSLGLASRNAPLVALGLGEIAGLTTVNLTIRWLRWHFLLRRFDFRMNTKESMVVWFASIPAIATPFYFGELIRALLLARRYPRALWTIPVIWVAERLADICVLFFVLFWMGGHWWIIAGLVLLAALGILVIRMIPQVSVFRTITNPFELSVIMLSTAAAWGMPILGLWLLLSHLGIAIQPAQVAEAFSVGTILGALSGIPFGVGVAGTVMILSLEAHGVAAGVSAIAIFIFRTGTVWYAVGVGLFTLIMARRPLARLLAVQAGESHFDEIAESYGENIPPHMVERLLDRKVTAMQDRLRSRGLGHGSRGLDVGCGQGWYIGEMTQRGFNMTGLDLSIQQVEQARGYLSGKGMAGGLCVADMTALPFRKGAFEFAFGINVMHHLGDLEARVAAFEEVLRVLQPEGIFFLQEINTRNPLFRFYMGYVFPLLRDIDEGTERWLAPSALPSVHGGKWNTEPVYFNFLPDFIPASLLNLFGRIERRLEQSWLRRWGSHYLACLTKTNLSL